MAHGIGQKMHPKCIRAVVQIRVFKLFTMIQMDVFQNGPTRLQNAASSKSILDHLHFKSFISTFFEMPSLIST